LVGDREGQVEVGPPVRIGNCQRTDDRARNDPRVFRGQLEDTVVNLFTIFFGEHAAAPNETKMSCHSGGRNWQ
jgi:hypothetical protein